MRGALPGWGRTGPPPLIAVPMLRSGWCTGHLLWLRSSDGAHRQIRCSLSTHLLRVAVKVSAQPPCDSKIIRASDPSPVASVPCGWQEFVIYERLQCVAECVLGVDGFGESGLAQFDRAHEGAGPLGRAVGECEVRMLVTVADQLAQPQRAKAVLGDDAIPQ